ncbi:MAG TPA: hypothetical protein VLM89_02690 [Phycisphaerae bacterium]|nr:hypothetical protein [Phycisphaerae bacterium]
MVVVGIIVLLVSITVPAVGPMLASNQQARVVNTLNGLLINAQAMTSQTASCVGLRVERAFKTSDLGLMLNDSGMPSAASNTPPVWLDHQQVRFVQLAAYRDQVFSHVKDSKVFELPKEYWLAPDYSLAAANLTEANLLWMPVDQNNTPKVLATFNRLENFYIIFSPEGDLTRYRAANLNYADSSQQYPSGSTWLTPRIQHPDASARSVFVYDRRQWNETAPDDDAGRRLILSQSRAVNISRVTASIVEEKTK